MKRIALLILILCASCSRDYNGIDISHHNALDWDAVKRDRNLEFCYIKATEGSTFVDKRYSYNTRKAKGACLKVGLYHYLSTHSSGKSQFDNFNRCLKAHRWDLIPVIDIERKGNDFSDIKRVETILSDFLEAFHSEYGYYPVVYYGDFIALRFLGTTGKCKSWFRTVHFSWLLPPVCFQQIAEAPKYSDKVDLNYCRNLDYILVKQ